MLQFQLSTRNSEGSLLLEELAELLHLLTKGITLAANVNGLSLLERRQHLTPAAEAVSALPTICQQSGLSKKVQLGLIRHVKLLHFHSMVSFCKGKLHCL